MSEQGLARQDPLTLADAQTLGQLLAKSGYFQDARDMAQAVVKVLAGRELGFGPVASMTGIYIVKGRVTLSANLMAAAIKRSGRYDYRIREHSAKACKVEFFQRAGNTWESVGLSDFTMEDAKLANLAHGDNWKQYPRNMLFARCMSNGAKWYCADVFGGPVYTPDELDVIVDGETGEVTAPETLRPRAVTKVIEQPKEPAPAIAEPSAMTLFPGPADDDLRDQLAADAKRVGNLLKLSAKERSNFFVTYCGKAARWSTAELPALTELVNALRARIGEVKWGENAP